MGVVELQESTPPLYLALETTSTERPLCKTCSSIQGNTTTFANRGQRGPLCQSQRFISWPGTASMCLYECLCPVQTHPRGWHRISIYTAILYPIHGCRTPKIPNVTPG